MENKEFKITRQDIGYYLLEGKFEIGKTYLIDPVNLTIEEKDGGK